MRRSGFGRQMGIGYAAYALAKTPLKRLTKLSRIVGLSKASGTANGMLLLPDGGSMKNRSSLSLNRRRTRKPKFVSFPYRIRNQDGQRAMKRSDELQSGELCW